ncbi:hypothetical protein [Flavobacterium notoginsengisoli]|uniref:hypothetical protein n=1 Tax=Flavobacterium notoginsengisoli TaxID=1478199 RepID=UPI00362C2690
MVDKSSKIKERILQIAEFKGIGKEKFFEIIGMTYGNFKGKSKLTPINSNAIEDLITNYPEIDLIWLLTGKGEMLKTAAKAEDVKVISAERQEPDYKVLYEEAKYTIELQKKYIENLEVQLKNKEL